MNTPVARPEAQARPKYPPPWLVVLLTLLLAPEAFVAIGLAFAGLLLAGLGLLAAVRFNPQPSAARRLAAPAR